MSRKRVVKYKGYARYNVDAALKKAVEKCKKTDGEILTHLLEEVDNGHKLSVSYDSESDTYAVGFYGHDFDSPYPGVGLSARHKEFPKACRILYVVHTELFANGWPSEPAEQPDQYSW